MTNARGKNVQIFFRFLQYRVDASLTNDPLASKSGLWSEVSSLLPAFLVMVVVLGAVAGGRPLGAAVLFGLFQELVQTEGIFLELHRPFPSLPMVGSRELLVWSKSNKTKGKKKKNIQVVHRSFMQTFPGLSAKDFMKEDLTVLNFISSLLP